MCTCSCLWLSQQILTSAQLQDRKIVVLMETAVAKHWRRKTAEGRRKVCEDEGRVTAESEQNIL